MWKIRQKTISNFTGKSQFFRQINVFTKKLISRKFLSVIAVLQYFSIWKILREMNFERNYLLYQLIW